MNRRKGINKIFADFLFSHSEEGNISIRKVCFEIKRFKDGETHRGEFEIRRVFFTSRNEFIFFAKSLGRTEDTKPYSSCIGRGSIRVPLSNFLDKNEILERIKKEVKNKNFFSKIMFIALEDGCIAFGPGATDVDRIAFVSQGLQVINWHVVKTEGHRHYKKRILYLPAISQKITKALTKCLK